jgi:hypothetical protein
MSTLPHRIRLRGPWDLLTRGEPCRTTLPGPIPPGTKEVSRSFGKPTGLTASDRVWICCELLEEGSTVMLNEQMLGMGTAFPFDITELIQERNRIHFRFDEVEVVRNLGEVYLEIRTVSPPSSVPG